MTSLQEPLLQGDAAIDSSPGSRISRSSIRSNYLDEDVPSSNIMAATIKRRHTGSSSRTQSVSEDYSELSRESERIYRKLLNSDGDLGDLIDDHRESHDYVSLFFGFKVTSRIYEKIWGILWIVNFAILAETIGLYLPSINVLGVNLVFTFENVTGAMIAAVVASQSARPGLYTQSYLMLDGIQNGFCSVYTAFANFIQQTMLLSLNFYTIGAAIANFFATIILSLLLFQLCFKLMIKWTHNRYLDNVLALAHPEARISHELEAAIENEAENVIEDDWDKAPSSNLSRTEEVELALQKVLHQANKKRHYHHMAWKHWVVFGTSGSAFVIGMLIALFIEKFLQPNGYYPEYEPLVEIKVNDGCVPIVEYYPGVEGDIAIFTYLVGVFMAVTGSLSGGYASFNRQMKAEVQWGTFRVNMLSMLLIAIAMNFRFAINAYETGYGWILPYADIVLARFIADFCGSFSAWSGLITETANLYNLGGRFVAAKNLVYTLFGAFAFFVSISLLLRLTIMFI